MSQRPPTPSAPADLPADPGTSYASLPLEDPPAPHATHQATSGGAGEPIARASDDSVDASLFDMATPVAYTFERMITVGGFGEIWEASQCSLARVVAIKRIRRDLLDRAKGDQRILRRYELGFRQEAMITASLEHPNIVPIHDLGLDVDGYPLLAMKLVRGKAWDRLIAEEFALPPADFLLRHLPIFLAVCQAVAFAHSRGIIHRDLKPSQIMVGEFGEVLLMDWGIAARLEDIRAAAAQGLSSSGMITNPSGTAAFMAPEQTESTLANLSTATDIFLLGGTLYYLLTGRVPHVSDSANGAFYAASRCELVPPQARNPQREVPRELATLAMDAMAREPRDRVASAEIVLRRLQDYITGDGRRRESSALAREVSKSLERRALTYADLNECNSRLDQATALWPENSKLIPMRDTVRWRYAEQALANGDLTLARLQGEQLRGSSDAEDFLHRLAQREREQREAAERIRLANANAQDLLNFMLLDLHGSLRELGRLDLLEKAALKVFQHFDQFPSDSSGSQAEQNRCVALRNIADVLREKARLEAAQMALKEAIRIAKRQLEKEPDNVDWLLDLSDSWDKSAALQYELGDLDKAFQLNTDGLRLRMKLLGTDEENRTYQSRLAWSYHQQGVIRWRMGDQAHALSDLSEAIRLRSEIIKEQPDNHAEVSAMGYGYNSKAWVERATGNLDRAIEDLRLSLRIRRGLVKLRPDNFNYQADVAWSLKSLALLLEDRLEMDESVSSFEEALDICQRLADSDPGNTARKMELAFCYGGLGRVQHTRGHLMEAEIAFRKAVGLYGEHVEREVSNGRDLRDHIYNLSGLCSVLLERGILAEALETAERAHYWGQKLMERTKENPTFVEARCRAMLHLGRVHATKGNSSEALELWQNVVQLMERFFIAGEYPPAQEETLAIALLLLDEKDRAQRYVDRLLRKGWGGREFLRLVTGKIS
jgi:serine/threonine protein kinase